MTGPCSECGWTGAHLATCSKAYVHAGDHNLQVPDGHPGPGTGGVAAMSRLHGYVDPSSAAFGDAYRRGYATGFQHGYRMGHRVGLDDDGICHVRS